MLTEDELGEVEFVTFGFFDPRGDVSDWLPVGTIFIVKEPFFGNANPRHVAIAANSPSDVVWVRPTSPLAGNWRVALTGNREFWLQKALAAFPAEKWHEALRCLERGMDFGLEPYDQCLRTAALEKLGRYYEATEIAKASAHRWPIPMTISRTAKCFLEARKWREALEFYERTVALGDESYVPDVEGCQARLAEERLGNFAWDAIAVNAAREVEDGGVPRFEVADYNGGTEIRPAGELGLGMFATRDFDTGELIMVEKAIFCVTTQDAMRSGMVIDLYALTGYCCSSLLAAAFAGNPWYRDDLYRLDGVRSQTVTKVKVASGQFGYRRTVGKVGLPDVPPPPPGIIDMLRLERAGRVLFAGQRHPFAGLSGKVEYSDAIIGLWPRQPVINHGCNPNMYDLLFGDLKVHRAARPIKKGEQLFHRYFIATSMDTRKMRDFVCGCPFCNSRIGDPLNERRLALFEKLARIGPGELGFDEYERIFAEFETLNPAACEIAVTNDFRALNLFKAARKEEGRAALNRASTAYDECGWMPDRRLGVVFTRLRELKDEDEKYPDGSTRWVQESLDVAEKYFGMGMQGLGYVFKTILHA